MKFRKYFILIVFVLVDMLSVNSACEEYKKLDVEKDLLTIKKEDLPDEFSDKAFKTIDDFIKKTYNLDYECLIYFDYISGEIVKCAMGKYNNVKISFRDGEFDDYHIASIHNHPLNAFSPQSDKNF